MRPPAPILAREGRRAATIDATVAKACELRDRDRNLEQVNDQRRILPGKYDVVRQLEVRAMHRPLLAAR